MARILLMLAGLFVLATPALAQVPPEDNGIRVYVDRSGQLHLENPPARAIDLASLPSDQAPASYTVYRSPWYNWWEDPAWLYLYGRYPVGAGPFGDSWWAPGFYSGSWWGGCYPCRGF